jgi:hypothetical protein
MHHTMLLEDVKSPKITLLIPKGRYLFFAFLEIILKNQKEKECASKDKLQLRKSFFAVFSFELFSTLNHRQNEKESWERSRYDSRNAFFHYPQFLFIIRTEACDYEDDNDDKRGKKQKFGRESLHSPNALERVERKQKCTNRK